MGEETGNKAGKGERAGKVTASSRVGPSTRPIGTTVILNNQLVWETGNCWRVTGMASLQRKGLEGEGHANGREQKRAGEGGAVQAGTSCLQQPLEVWVGATKGEGVVGQVLMGWLCARREGRKNCFQMASIMKGILSCVQKVGIPYSVRSFAEDQQR